MPRSICSTSARRGLRAGDDRARPRPRAFEAEYLAIGRAWALTRQVAYGTSTEGAEIERPSLILADSRDGRFTHSEMFAPEQLAEALARFEELEAAERP